VDPILTDEEVDLVSEDTIIKMVFSRGRQKDKLVAMAG
jgi:hypothetical protein